MMMLPQKRENMVVITSGLDIWEEKLLEYNNNKTQIKQEAGGQEMRVVKSKNIGLGLDSNLLIMPLMHVSFISVCCRLCKWC